MLKLPKSIAKRVGLFGLTLFFAGAGVTHFADPGVFLAIMPDYLPLHLEIVYASGAFEIALGIGVLVPSLRQRAGYGLVALLIAVFPANIEMAVHPEPFLAEGATRSFIYGRLPFQFLFMYWAIWATRPDPVE
jgi:uncharacterized membrane protein